MGCPAVCWLALHHQLDQGPHACDAGHCKALAEPYEKAATALKGKDPPIVLAKMEATEDANKATAAKYSVQGYPTLKAGPHGVPSQASQADRPGTA